ncbi:hypothetical protein BJ165DRAFT_992441 [Panaeolus papilionaceus]|nr:hypothetical protein BJ165DRAFT_992441 [Panaeolus papilionaceus]
MLERHQVCAFQELAPCFIYFHLFITSSTIARIAARLGFLTSCIDLFSLQFAQPIFTLFQPIVIVYALLRQDSCFLVYAPFLSFSLHSYSVSTTTYLSPSSTPRSCFSALAFTTCSPALATTLYILDRHKLQLSSSSTLTICTLIYLIIDTTFCYPVYIYPHREKNLYYLFLEYLTVIFIPLLHS